MLVLEGFIDKNIGHSDSQTSLYHLNFDDGSGQEDLVVRANLDREHADNLAVENFNLHDKNQVLSQKKKIDEFFTNSCTALTPPINGTMQCSDGFFQGSTCEFSCQAHPKEYIFPLQAVRKKCLCGKKTKAPEECKWTKSRYTQALCLTPKIKTTHQCESLPYFDHMFTKVYCDLGRNHGSKCEVICEKDFKIVGDSLECNCHRKRGQYLCHWNKPLDNKYCSPLPRWYRKWHRKYRKAVKRNNFVLRNQLMETYKIVTKYATPESNIIIPDSIDKIKMMKIKKIKN